ncbi:retrovirus-related pol polyprotein from transposon TNT 1-94 [Tanacetum coccineum]
MATSSSSIASKLKSPTSSTSPLTSGYLNSPISPLPRVPSPPLTQECESMDITLTLSPITLLYIQFNTPSPPSPLFGHPIPWNLLEAHGATCLCISQNFPSPYTPEQNGIAKRKNRTLIEAARIILNGSVLSKHFRTKAVRIACYTQNRSIIDHLGKFDAKADDGCFLGYSFVSKAFRVFNTRRKQVEETYHVTFDESIEAIRFTNTSEDEIGIDDSSRYPSNKFIHEDDPSRQYQTDSDISYYNEQIITQPTKGPSGNNTEVSVSINESLVPDVPQSHISNQAFTSSYPVPQDRWSKDQHIKLVNIIGDPGEGMLAKSMAAKLTVVSASECLFVNFLFEIEPKKVSEALKHLGWVDAMQEELIRFYRNKVWTLVPLLLVTQGYSQEEGIYYDETFAPVTRMKAIRIFLAFDTYMNFKVYQIDVKSAFINGKLKEEVYVKQPPGFESNEFLDYVCKLDKSLYGLKQAPKAWYENLSTFLIQNKFTRGRIDNTLFICKSKGEVLFVQVYVDDIIFSSTSYKLCKQFEKLMTKKFEMSMIGELTYFLILQIKHDDKGISICQEQYTRNLLKKYEISNSPSVKTPMVPLNNLGPDLAGKLVNETSYRGMIVSLMYLTATRPDIQSSIVLCFDLKGYSDSDYAGCNMDKKITTGACEILGGKLVCWSAKKQQSVVISSAKVEYVVAVRDHILKGDNELHFIPTEYCHTPKWGLDGIRVRRRDVITYTAQDQVNDH